MKKTVLFIIALTVILALFGCSSDSAKAGDSTPADSEVTDGFYDGDLTLKLSFGEKTGRYKGDLVKGLPQGQGEFTSKSDDGSQWTYLGEWREGHFEGEGQIQHSNGDREVGFYSKDMITPMSEAETKKMMAEPENYKDHCVQLLGLVFLEPEVFDEGLAFNMYTDIENYKDNVVVYLYGHDILVKDGDIIRMTGIVGEVFEGENAYGTKLALPTIHSKNYEVIAYDELYPLVASTEVKETQTQFGYSITVEKIEVTEKETRVYIKVDNKGAAIFSPYCLSSLIIQEDKEYEEQYNWEAKYPEVEADIDPGASSQGVISYPPIEAKNFTLIIGGSSDNNDERIEDYIFNIDF